MFFCPLWRFRRQTDAASLTWRQPAQPLLKAQRTLTVTDVLPLANHVYAERNMMGCCLHIALDDDNLSDSNIQFCIDRAVEQGHGDCETLARLMLRMTTSQRGRLAQRSGRA